MRGQILERVAALPGVTASGMIEDVLQRRNPDYQIMIAGRAGQSSEPVSGDAISPGCFETLGVRLLKGRFFTDTDEYDGPGDDVAPDLTAAFTAAWATAGR